MLAPLTELTVWAWVSLAGYVSCAALLSIYGVHRLTLIFLYFWHRDRAELPIVRLHDQELPEVLVQLPVFNERHVAERLINCIAALNWPREKMLVQVLDDSTDSSSKIIEQACRRHKAAGLRIEHLRRTSREGFKAGALANGLSKDSNNTSLVAIFDADFLPRADFLKRTVPALLARPEIAMVQGRWEHLNRDEKLITKLQAILLDGHFVLEHSARFRSGRFFNFNGTAGLWRRAAITSGGGWRGDTLCEDLDLSYRTQLAGWDFVYLQDLGVPSELPAEVCGFKTQQHRWAKGSIQTAVKLLPSIWAAQIGLPRKVEATFHLAANLAYPLMALLLLLLPLSLTTRMQLGSQWGLLIDLPIFICATINLVIFYAVAEVELRDGRWQRRLHLIPFVLALGAGLTINNTRAVWEALSGIRSPFVRTPKAGDASAHGYSRSAGYQAWFELAFALYYLGAIAVAASHGLWHALPFLALFTVGFGYVGLASLREAHAPASLRTSLAIPARPAKVQAGHRQATEPKQEQATDLPDAAASMPDRQKAASY
jgi:cellulose synthase/poly-beta-1,6-N-acetylglucosamine synthase-like glycosyltransferase